MTRSALVLLLLLIAGCSTDNNAQPAASSAPVVNEPLTPTERKERFCDLWGGAADLAESLIPGRDTSAPDPRVIEAFRAAAEVATDNMDDEIAIVVDAYSEAAAAEDDLPDPTDLVDSTMAVRRLDRWFGGNCSLADGTPPADGVWQDSIDNHPTCIAVERYLTAVEIAGDGGEDLPVVVESLANLIELLPDDERVLAEQLPLVYINETHDPTVFAGTELAAICALPTG